MSTVKAGPSKTVDYDYSSYVDRNLVELVKKKAQSMTSPIENSSKKNKTKDTACV